MDAILSFHIANEFISKIVEQQLEQLHSVEYTLVHEVINKPIYSGICQYRDANNRVINT